MQNNITITELVENQKSNKALEVALIFSRFRSGIWLFGIPSWLFGISDRSFAAFADGYLSVMEVIQLFTASFFFASWLFLRPEDLVDNHDIVLSGNHGNVTNFNPEPKEKYIISEEHFLSKQYILPGSYWTNMFHTLNPLHLNHVHKITQNGIKVTEVTQYRETEMGGILTFTSVMDQIPGLITDIQKIIKYIPIINLLNKYIDMLRRPAFTSQLILHSAYTTELYIPADKYYTSIVFYVHPIEQNKCELFIDFYSNLPIPKICKHILFQIITPIVVWEDKVYLLKLSQKEPEFFTKVRRKVPDNHFLRLSQRFIELYGSQS
ncbi:MAG: hypothetical protein IGS23_22080 [Rivularia sp. T60_A2020_040]|nr:hypothetical protein [Rivularia sp. T60_A2020_040]